MTTAKEIREKIAETKTNHGFIAINGYRSEAGRVMNVTLQPLGDNGYHNLIRQSIEQVEKGDIVKPESVDQEVWDEAIQSQMESWQKSLAGEQGRLNKFSKDEKGFYTHDEQGDTITVRNVRIIRKEIIVEGEYKTVNSRPLTIAKKLLVAQTPVSTYQGSFKLEVGKFDRIRFNRTEIQGE